MKVTLLGCWRDNVLHMAFVFLAVMLYLTE